MPEGVTHIGARAFAGCTALRRLVLPASVRTIEDGAFEGVPAGAIETVPGSYAERRVLELGLPR